jgi:hypothetical protein
MANPVHTSSSHTTTPSTEYEEGEVIPFQQEQREWTRSIFPPYPHNIPFSTTSFSISFSSSLEYYQHVKRKGASNTLHILLHVLAHHARASEHNDEKQHEHVMTHSKARSDHIIDIQDISRVYFSMPYRRPCSSSATSSPLTQSNQKQVPIPNQQYKYKLYVYCTSTEACHRVRQSITQNTTLTCDDARERIIVGQVATINFRHATSLIISFIKSHVPQITSLIITRIKHKHPSTHYKDYAYFSILASEIKYLHLIPPLPGSHVPLSWYKFTRPIVSMCTLCYSKEHTRSKCPSRHLTIIYCSTCGKSGHMARMCTQQHPKCLCCESPIHNVLSCPQYVPKFDKIDIRPTTSDFPPLSPTSSNPSINTSPPSSPASDVSIQSVMHSDTHIHRHHKRARHTSFDTESIESYESRPNHPPNSPLLQQHLDNQSLTRSNSSKSTRSLTPLPHRRSSSVTSSSSSSSTRETQMEQMIQEQQKRIELQQNQIHEQTNMITLLQQQLQTISSQLQQLILQQSTQQMTTNNTTLTSPTNNTMHE